MLRRPVGAGGRRVRWSVLCASFLCVLGTTAPPPSPREDTANTTLPPAFNAVNWRTWLGPRQVAKPALWDEGSVMFGWASGITGADLVAVRADSGAVVTSERMQGLAAAPIEAPVLYAGAAGDPHVPRSTCIVYVVAGNNSITAFNYSSWGVAMFSVPFPSAPSRPLLVRGGAARGMYETDVTKAHIFVTAVGADGRQVFVYKIDALTGDVAWRVALFLPDDTNDPPRATTPTIMAQKLYVLTTGALWSLSPETGITYDTVSVAGAPIDRSPPQQGYLAAHRMELIIVSVEAVMSSSTHDTAALRALDRHVLYPSTIPPGHNALPLLTRVYAVNRYGGTVWCHIFDPSTRVQVPPSVFNNSHVIFTSVGDNPADGPPGALHPQRAQLVALSMTTGQRAWTSPWTGSATTADPSEIFVYSAPVLAPESQSVLVAGMSNGTVALWKLYHPVGLASKWEEEFALPVVCHPFCASVPAEHPGFVVSGSSVVTPAVDGAIYSVTVGLPPVPVPFVPQHSHAMVGYLCGGVAALLVCLAVLVPKWALRRAPAPADALTPDADTPRGELVGQGWMEAVGEDAAAVARQAQHSYTVLRKLGSGAFGTVYKVRSLEDGQYYALKKLPCDSDGEQRQAVAEWMHLCAVQHPNKVAGYRAFYSHPPAEHAEGTPGADAKTGRSAAGKLRGWVRDVQRMARGAPPKDEKRGRDRTSCAEALLSPSRFMFLVMRYYPRGDLRMYIRSLPRHVPMEEPRIFRYSAQIASLLRTLHAQSPPISHRDLKPENILLTDDGRDVVVTDFGLARPIASGEYLKTHAGTYAYISPETWGQHYSVEVDVWALGCIMYAMASKRVDKKDCRCLWKEASHAGFQQSLHDELLHVQHYSPHLADVVTALLTPDRRERPSADDAVRIYFSGYLADDGSAFACADLDWPPVDGGDAVEVETSAAPSAGVAADAPTSSPVAAPPALEVDDAPQRPVE